jgi:hypothetical protein
MGFGLSCAANADIYFSAYVYEEVQYTLTHSNAGWHTGMDPGIEDWGITMYRNTSYCYYEQRNNLRPGDPDEYATAVFGAGYLGPASTEEYDHPMCWATTVHMNHSIFWVGYEGTGEWQTGADAYWLYYEWAF